MRTNLASLFLSKELNLPYELNYHEAYVNSWAALLKDEPGELFKAAEDAQKIVDHVLGYEKQVEQKHEAGQDEQVEESKVTEAEIDTPKINPDKLNKGEVIPYNGTEFKVVTELKNKVYQMQDLGTERKFKMSAKDELFHQLLGARNNSQEISTGRENLTEDEITYHENEAVEEFLDSHLQIER